MKELDALETQLKKQQASATAGLEHLNALRKLLPTALAPTPKANGGQKKAAQSMSPGAARKQREASREYWRKVRAGEIKRKGFTPKKD